MNGSIGFSNVEVACVASGSGNDFVKNFHNLEKFRDLDKEIAGSAKKIDLLKVDDHYCINITNYGFDGEVTFAQLIYKRRPFMSLTTAPVVGLVTTLPESSRRAL